MPEENPSAMNLDLNLGPLDNSSDDGDSGTGSNPAINITDWLESPVRGVRQVVRNRTRRLSPWSRQLPMPQTRPSGDISVPTGDDSKIPEKNPDSCTDDNVHGEKDDISKKNGGENSFFDCNICLDVAKDPVVTCCGHLFCWPCLYRWLHHHSSTKECPVCKGEVNPKNVVPIYGRGDTIRNPPNTDPSLPIPVRPQAHRVESWRQTVRSNAFAIPIQEVITHLATMSDLRRAQREQDQNPDHHDRDHEESMGGINRLLHSRLLTSSGMRRERPNPRGLVDYDDTEFHAWTSIHEFQSGAEGVAEPDTHSSNPVVIPTPFDDRDSLSSIAAVIQSESQTVDNVVEIDSTVARSTSSSRRTNDASRIPDVDSGDSRAPRRRRLY